MDQNHSGVANVPQGSKFNFTNQNIYGSQYLINNFNGNMFFSNRGNSQFGGVGHAYMDLSSFEREGFRVKNFVEHYYIILDSNSDGLANFYREGSTLTFEGEKIQGSQNIVAVITSHPFQLCHRSITTFDCQPSGANGGMLVFARGSLHPAGVDYAKKFRQVFHLIPTPQGSYYVLNDILHLDA